MTVPVRAAILTAAVGAAIAAAAPATAAPATAAPRKWAPATTATIHPGVQTFTAGAQCTANFVLYDASNVYLGQAAHCAGTGSSTDTNGWTSGSLPIGTPVDIGGSRPGTLVYSSWLTMQRLGETDPDTCQYNDLALVRVDPADAVGGGERRDLDGREDPERVAGLVEEGAAGVSRNARRDRVDVVVPAA